MCATEEITRWDGIYELSPKSDFMSEYDEDKNIFLEKYKLNKSQKQELRKILFKIKKLQFPDIGLIDLVAEKNDQALINFLIKHIKKDYIQEKWYKNIIMLRIAQFTKRKDLMDIAQEIEKLDYYDKKTKQKSNELTRKFIQKL